MKTNITMNIIKTDIDGVLIIEPQVFGDSRGWFCEIYNEERYRAAGIDVMFVQDNQSFSSYGVVRGLHFQKPPFTQAKLVSCVIGEVLDVALDLRPDSHSFGKHVAVRLSADNKRQLFLPKGFAHGFSVLSERALFSYKCDEFYHPEADGGILLTDKQLNIDWLIPQEKMILSEKDKRQPKLSELGTTIFQSL